MQLSIDLITLCNALYCRVSLTVGKKTVAVNFPADKTIFTAFETLPLALVYCFDFLECNDESKLWKNRFVCQNVLTLVRNVH